jgi:hypothetical protein
MEQRLMVPPQKDSGLEEDHWNSLWEKNWDILLAVLHNEDFPLLRNSQRGMASADAGDMLLGRNETANQVFRRETIKLLAQGNTTA